MHQLVGRRLWILALAFGVAGVCGLADLGIAAPAGKLLLVGPHAVGVALTVWTGRRRTAAGLVAVAGSAALAGLSWVDALGRQTEGFEWRFNNALQGAMCVGANWLVLSAVGCISLLLAAADPLFARSNSGPGPQVGEPGATPDGDS
jgi:hypothetical protein